MDRATSEGKQTEETRVEKIETSVEIVKESLRKSSVNIKERENKNIKVGMGKPPSGLSHHQEEGQTQTAFFPP